MVGPEPLGRNWGVQTVGLVRLDDTPEARQEGLTTYLLAEALRQYQLAGYGQFEAQAAATDISRSLTGSVSPIGSRP